MARSFGADGRTHGSILRGRAGWQIAFALVLSCFLLMSQFPLPPRTVMASPAQDGVPSQLVFTTPPGDGDPGTALASQPVVAIEDGSNTTVISDTSPISLTLNDIGGAAHASLTTTFACTQTVSGTTSLDANAGVATFDGCSVDRGGTYTLTATDAADNLTATSSPFFISGPAQLVFNAQPGGGDAGAAWASQPQVTVEDANGTVITTTNQIGLAIAPGTGTAGANLTCTPIQVTPSATTGIASFAGCAIDASGGGYQLVAIDENDNLISSPSDPITITAGPPASLVFTAAPLAGSGGAAFSTQPAVAVEDADGNVISGNTDNISLSITSGTGTSGAHLTCTTNPVTASAGVATFGGCAIDDSGTGYTLTATDSASNLSAATTPFTVTAGSATQIAFSTPPGGGAAGAAFGTQPVVSLQDSGGNGLSGPVTLSITTTTGPTDATLTCDTNPVTADAHGVATFSGCSVNKTGSNYMLTATSGALSVNSSSFGVTTGSVAAVAFTTQPGGGTGGSAWSIQPTVVLSDSSGLAAAGAVTLSLTTGLGTPGATLACAHNPVTAVNGVATFSGCRVDKIGTGYTLTATSGSVSASSNPFDVTTGAPAQLAFSTQPGGGTGGTAWSTQPIVAVEDAGGNQVGTSAASISLSITPGTGAGTLSCAANPLPAVNGAALFAGCAIDKTASAYTLTATDAADGLNTVSAPFAVTPGPAAKLVFRSQPGGATASTAFPTQPVVAVADAGGNTVPGSSAGIALAITPGTGASGATLTCAANSTSASQGVAAFNGCAIDKAAGGYTLTATDAADGLSTESLAFAVPAGSSVTLGQAPTGVPPAQTFGGQVYGANPSDIVDHVNTATGALTFAATDLRVAGIGEPLVLQRTYNSADTAGGAFGPGWSSLLDVSVLMVKNKTATVRGEDGQQLVWTFNAATNTWMPPPGAKATLQCGSKMCTLTRFDGVRWDVNLTTNGRQEIVDYLAPDGQGLKFAWTSSQVTITIASTNTTPYNVVATLNGAGQVMQVKTPKGRTVSYAYQNGLLSSVTDARGNTWTYAYNSAGLLTGETDPLANQRLSATYDASGRVTAVSAKGGPQHTDDQFSWNAATQTSTRMANINVHGTPTREPYVDAYLNNALVSQTQPTGAITRYSYDAQVNLIAVQDPMGWVQQLAYDAGNNLIRQSTPINATSSATVSMTYDTSHRILTRTDADGNLTTYVYNGPYLGFVRPGTGSNSTATLYYNKMGELIQSVTPLGQQLFSYDAFGNQISVLLEDLSGHTLNGKGTLATYDEAGDLLTTTDGRGTTTGNVGAYTTTRTYDAAGNLLSTTTPGPRTTTTTYDRAGDVATLVDAAHNTTAYSWNEGALTRTTTITPTGAITPTTSMQLYDPSGDLLTETNAANRTTTHVYDAGGREVATTDPANVTTQYTYDLEGNVVAVTDSAGDTLTRQLDALNRPIREVNDGIVTRTGYDPAGNVTSTTDASGSVTTTTYNSDNKVASVTNAAGTTSYAYDAVDDLVSRTDPNGHVTTYTYDGAGRQTAMTVNGAKTTYGYDVAGNVTTITDPDGRTTTYTLDALNRPTTTKYSQSGQTAITVTQTYDALGHRTGMTDATGTHTYTYDASGDLTSAKTVSGGVTDTFSYDYSQPGKIVETYPDGTPVTYTVDDAQNLMSVSSGTVGNPGYVNASYIRNALRQTTGIAFSNGVLDTRSLDQAGNILDQTLQNATTKLADDAFTYDAAGNRLSQVDNVGGTATSNQYGYDTTGRLTGFSTSTGPAPLAAIAPATVSLAGTAGSLQAGTSGGTPASSAAVVTAPPFQPASAPSTATAAPNTTVAPAYTYDAAGNQLSSMSAAGTTNYTYNAGDQITSQSGPGGSTTWTYDKQGDVTQIAGPSSTQKFTYDAADHLISVATGGSTITYTYDGDGNRVSKTVNGNSIATQYLWDPAGVYPRLAIERTSTGTLIRRYIYGDGPVAMQTPSATYFYHLDPQGSVAELSDGTGAIVAAYHYDGFGNVATTGTSAPANPLLFQGQFLDSDIGLYNMRARNYDPTTGRFTQRDPAATPVGVPVVSPYVFVADHPTTLADPTGQFPSATSVFWGQNTIAGNVLKDTTYAVTAIKVGAKALPKVYSYLESKLSSEATTAEEEIAPDVGEVADATSEVAADTSTIDGALGEVGGELGPGSEALAGATEASKLGPALMVVGIALQVATTVVTCLYGTVTQCVAAAVSTAISIAFTIGCTVLTEGAGAIACNLVGGLISVGVAYVINRFGPQIAAGFVDLYNAEVAGWTAIGNIVAAGLVSAGNAIAGAAVSAAGAIATGFNEATAAISSGFNTALNTLKAAGYSAAQIAIVLANTFKEGLTDAVGALVSLGYEIDGIAQAAFSVFKATAEEAAALFKEGFDYTVAAVATMLKDVYKLADAAAAQILQAINYAVDEVAGALKVVFHDLDAAVATVLQGLNYGIEQIGAALQQVFHDLDAAVATVLRGLTYTADQVATALEHLYNEAAQAVATALAAASYAVSEVAHALKYVFAEAGQAAAAILKAVFTAVVNVADKVAAALESVYQFAAQQVAQILENISFTITEVAHALSIAFNAADRAVAAILHAIGNAAADIASALNTVFHDADVAVAAALAFAGFAAAQVAAALRTAFNDIDSAVATALRAAGYAVTEIAAALQSVFHDIDSAVATVLKNLGYAATEVAQALRYAFNEAAQAVATVLKDIGYAADQIASALSGVFNLVAAGVAQVLKDIGEAATVIKDVLTNVYHEAVSAISSVLSAIGFTSDVIDAIGGAFTSFGHSVKHFFDSIF